VNAMRWILVVLIASVPIANAFDALALDGHPDIRYRLHTPKIEAGKKYPLVLYLHGSGTKGSDNEKPMREPLAAFFARAETQKDFPCFVLVPQCTDGKDALGRPHNWVNWKGQSELPPAQWTEAEDEASEQLKRTLAILDDVLRNPAIDSQRVYVCGVSMGGSGTWYLSSRHAEKFSAAIAICGLSETRMANKLAALPVWIFHGEKDATVPVARSREMAEALKKFNAPVRFTEFPGAGHGLESRVIGEAGLLKWLFAQKHSSKEALSPEAKLDPKLVDFFETRVRPVLLAHCVECHGEKKHKGGLRLDSRTSAFAGGDIGPAIMAGDAEKSPLIRAVRYTDEDLQMPPKLKLPDAVIADLVEWVKRGAVWPEDKGAQAVSVGGEMQFSDAMKSHWSFQPIKKPAVPTPKNAESARNEIDRFILSKLDAAKLQPSPIADKRTLVRRVTFDLIGLPPSPEEVAAFEADTSPDAFSKVTKRLLASPHYGERWGRHWLDVARYADSNGSEVDHAMANAWRYRDYVVSAFNADMPFDQFVREQIAGDLLPNATGSTMAATGFLMLGPKALADLDKPKLLADVIDEQVDTTCRAFMGMTMGCARCHDHKFDPLPTADYYALAGIFRSTRSMDMSKRVATWTERPLGATDNDARISALNKRIAELRSERDKSGKEKKKPALAASAKFLLVEAEHFTRGNVRVETDSLGKGIGVIRTRMEYPDHIEYEFELPEAGEYQLELRYAAKEKRATQLLINGNLEDESAAAEVTGDWTPAAQRWFVQGAYQFKAGTNVLAFHRDGPVPIFDKWIVGRVSAEPHWKSLDLKKTAGVNKPNDDTNAKRVKEIDAAIAVASDELSKFPVVMAPFDGPVADAPILARGSAASPGARVPRGFLRIVKDVDVPRPGPSQSGRLELAQWLTHPNNPLTARVIVNRIWLWHFGEGLVRSPDNFGRRGETPSHPELLDWLATWFVENGGSVKKLHELICSSATYQQASRTSSAADPENRLLAHFPRRRLDAEALRDAMLVVSGRLDRSIGGSLMTVLDRTYANGGNAPADIAKQMHYDTPRRSIYLPIIRNGLHDFFAVFNYPDPGMLTGKRAQTTVAPQALFMMNSPFVLEQSKLIAARIQMLGKDDRERLRAAYELAVSRVPSEQEIARALAFIDREESELRAGGAPNSRQVAWARFCHALLASNDFIYVR